MVTPTFQIKGAKGKGHSARLNKALLFSDGNVKKRIITRGWWTNPENQVCYCILIADSVFGEKMACRKNKTLCKWKKEEIKERHSELAALVAEPKFICERCARAASKKKYLCKPAKLTNV